MNRTEHNFFPAGQNAFGQGEVLRRAGKDSGANFGTKVCLGFSDEHWVRREPSTVSLLHNLTIAKINTPFAQFESGLSTGVKHE